MGRYDKHYNLDFSGLTKPVAQEKPKHDPLADFLRFASGVAPAAGTAIGAGVGSMAGGIGAIPGAAIGGGIGSALGAAGNFGADTLERGADEDLKRKQAQDEEEAARHRAALQMLGGF